MTGHDLAGIPLENLLIDMLKPIKKDWGPVESKTAVHDSIRGIVFGTTDPGTMIDQIAALIIEKHDERVLGMQRHLRRYRAEIARRIWVGILNEPVPEVLRFEE